MPAVSTAWDQALVAIDTKAMLRMLADVSRLPLDELPGDPFPPSQPDSVVRKAQGYGIEIAFSVVPREEMPHGLRLTNVTHC